VSGENPAYFMRSVNGGLSWEETRFTTVPGAVVWFDTPILDPRQPHVLITAVNGDAYSPVDGHDVPGSRRIPQNS
jgi:hypothetical protein